MAAAVAFFCWAISLCYIPQKGFSGLVQFGDSFVERQLPEVRALNPYVMEHSMGYDGQFYAQLAVRPDPADPEVQRALDTPAYRRGGCCCPGWPICSVPDARPGSCRCMPC